MKADSRALQNYRSIALRWFIVVLLICPPTPVRSDEQTAVTSTRDASLSQAAPAANNGAATLYFKPDANFNGQVNFTYTATDSGNADGSGVLTSPAVGGVITVTPVNDAPVAIATSATGAEDR